MHQYPVHAEHIGYRQCVVLHGLLGQIAVQAVELVEMGSAYVMTIAASEVCPLSQ